MPAYPGLGFDLRLNEQSEYGFYPIGAHGSCYGSESDMLPIRELAMMSVMESLTDKEEWHKKVFDDEIVSKWRKETLEIPDEEFWKMAVSGKSQYWDQDGTLHVESDVGSERITPPKGNLDQDTFDCCIEELRSKARYYEHSGIVPTLDACASVAKSDSLVSTELQASLQRAFKKLQDDQSTSPDWHPNSNSMVQDLVHPSMYPLVYGRSRVLKEEVVGVGDAIETWAGKGEIIPKNHVKASQLRAQHSYNVGGGEVPPEFWSETYQWLPANVAFRDDGTVRFTSYINNLHPTKHADIYGTIEKLIETALPAWDQCLAIAAGYEQRDGAGRVESRFGPPDDPDDENEENWIPHDPKEVANVEVNWEEVNSNQRFDQWCDDETESKWKLLRQPALPDAVFEDVDYAPKSGKRLAEKFKESGLQIIVKIASIELTPDKPEFPTGGWHIEGQMNEHICGTALYYLDCDNVTASNLSFRMQTSAYLHDDISVGQDGYHWMEQVYGTGLGGGSSPCLQNYGTVETRQGRLLAFPNVLQHRVSSFRLADPSKPGHRRFIALWLVDPHKRIISTANVPPQQMDWWLESVLGNAPEAREKAMKKLPTELMALLKEKGFDGDISAAEEGKLPPELMEMVREHFNAGADVLPMATNEAKEHRLKLMQERSAFVETAESGWQQHSYSFCEH